MTVTNTHRSVTYNGDGSTTLFPFSDDGPIYFLSNSDLVVTLIAADGTETVQSIGTNYTVTGAGDPDGGSVTMVVAPAAGEQLRIERVVALVQQTNYPENTKFPAASHERALDRLTMIDQQQQEELDRAPKFSETSKVRNVTFPEPETGKLIGWSGDKLSNMVVTKIPDALVGATGLEVLSSGTKQAAREAMGLSPLAATGSFSDLVGAPPLSRFSDSDEARSIQVNEVPASGGGFPRTPPQEIADIFSGNNPDKLLPNLAPVDLAECLIIPPTEESTNFVAPTVPWLDVGGGAMRRVIPMDIRTNLFNTPLNIPLFEPVKVNGFGILTFKYIGGEPIHTVLKGSLAVLIRASARVAEPYARHTLRLRAVNPPHLEDGENGGTRNLATSIGGYDTASKIRNYYELNDRCFPITQSLLDDAVTFAWPDYFTGSVNGYFNPGDDTEALRTDDPPGSGIPVGPEVRTTDWMDVSADDKLVHSYFFDCTGTSRRRRVQIKTDDGTIKTFTPMTDDRIGSRGVFRLPADAAHVRIYYSGPGDTAVSERFIRIGDNTSPEFDPLKGFWVMRNFNVHRDIVLWPGTEYYFDLFTEVGDGGSAREWGFRFQSGGLSFLFDASRVRKSLAKKLFRSV